MDKETVVEMILTKDRIESGKTLVEKLDERGLLPGVVFWLYYPDLQQYKLILADVDVVDEGPKEIYRRIQEILWSFKKEIGDLSLTEIVFAKTDMPIVALLRKTIQTGPGIGGLRFTNNVIDGTVIEDAYIYRLN
jgi:superfamily II RNA helicase